MHNTYKVGDLVKTPLNIGRIDSFGHGGPKNEFYANLVDERGHLHATPYLDRLTLIPTIPPLSLENFQAKPYWIDKCGHRKDDYVGTFAFREANWQIYDVYLYQAFNSIHVCLRFGNTGEDYESPGPIASLNEQNSPDHYRIAYSLIPSYRK